MSPKKGTVYGNTQEQMDALKTFLSPARPISKRAAMYRLLSMGLLESTKDFHAFNRKMNLALDNPNIKDAETFSDECFQDNRRRVVNPFMFPDIGEFKEWCRGLYHRDLWQTQPERVEVWLEKDTIAALVEEVTSEMDVRLRVSSGSFSRTFLYLAAKQVSSTLVPLWVLYAGDFDPSGLFRVEEPAKKAFREFLINEFGWTEEKFDRLIHWVREGVTEGEYRTIAEKARVPLKEDKLDGEGNKIKGDTSAARFKELYSDYGVEVEALEVAEPGGLAARLRRVILEHIDMELWNEQKRVEAEEIAGFRIE
jgi:hypothetical protein